MVKLYNRQFYYLELSILVMNFAEDSDEFLDKY